MRKALCKIKHHQLALAENCKEIMKVYESNLLCRCDPCTSKHSIHTNTQSQSSFWDHINFHKTSLLCAIRITFRKHPIIHYSSTISHNRVQIIARRKDVALPDLTSNNNSALKQSRNASTDRVSWDHQLHSPLRINSNERQRQRTQEWLQSCTYITRMKQPLSPNK